MGKQVQSMVCHGQILFACLLFMLMTQVYGQSNDEVLLKIVDGAVEKGAVCIDGTPAGYHYAPGSGDGANNWLVNLMGGGWCWERLCVPRIGKWNGSAKNMTTISFEGALSSNQSINPEFYNWNRVYVRYCDGASFIGDNEANDTGTLVQLRGSRIFNAVMEELLERGLKNANNAILSGGSAGGLAVILHCDDFRSLLPNVGRVKCLSDGGFFIRAKDLPFAHTREWVYDQTVKFHNLTNFLPTYCTSRMNASLCLFPEYLVGFVKTPLFILNSGFDFFQVHDNMAKYPDPQSWENCTNNTSNCTPHQIQRIKDFGNAFHDTIKQIGDNPSRGLFINSCFVHGLMDLNHRWNSIGYGLENKTIAQAFGDWYFDRSPVKLIDTHNDFAVYCDA